MIDRRPILLGMNNPLSSDPDHALYPRPDGCTGHRIWRMLTERTGCTRAQYLDAFDRRNLLCAREWSSTEALIAAVKFLNPGLQGRTIVVLGEGPRRALRLKKKLIEPTRMAGAIWRQLPHPSGRCRFYNDPLCRDLAAMLLEELYVDATREEREG